MPNNNQTNEIMMINRKDIKIEGIENTLTSNNVSHMKHKPSAGFGSEPNLPKIPLMTAFSMPVNMTHQSHQTKTALRHFSLDVDVDVLNKANKLKHEMQPEVSQQLNGGLSSSHSPSSHLHQEQNQHSVYKVTQHHNQTLSPVSSITSPMANSNSIKPNISSISSASNVNEISNTLSDIQLNNSISTSTNDVQSSQQQTVSKDHRVIALEAKLKDGNFMREFDLLPRMNPTAKFTTALLPENIYRNRFRDILPYEDNR